MTDCWLGKTSDKELIHFNCQHTSRVNYHGHRVQDVSMHGPESELNYSLVIWKDPDTDELEVDFIRKGESQRVTAWYDDEDDLRWEVGDYEFALRYSQAAMRTSKSFGPSRPTRESRRIDMDRPMGRDLPSEYGL